MNEQQGRNINMHVSGTSALQQGCAAAPPVFEKSLLLTRVIMTIALQALRWPLQRETQVSNWSEQLPVSPKIRGSDTSPARWWVWISSRPVKVLKDLRSLKATTGTMSSSLVSTSCDVFVPTGSLTASSMVPLCTGCVFSFGWASFGKAFTDSDLCVKKNESLYSRTCCRSRADCLSVDCEYASWGPKGGVVFRTKTVGFTVSAESVLLVLRMISSSRCKRKQLL